MAVDAGWIEAIREEARVGEANGPVVDLPMTARTRAEVGVLVEKFLWLSRWFEETIGEINHGLGGNKFLLSPADAEEIRECGEGRMSVIFQDKRFQIYQVYIPIESRLKSANRNFVSYGKLVLHNAKVPLGTTEYELGLLPEGRTHRWMLIINDGQICELDRVIQERLVEWLVSGDRWLTSIRLF
ncbi:MAG: hypothetical protein KC466_18355 [Myxococcales bacterium]|nr:hypothetical protein [Myxococcales bacterium]